MCIAKTKYNFYCNSYIYFYLETFRVDVLEKYACITKTKYNFYRNFDIYFYLETFRVDVLEKYACITKTKYNFYRNFDIYFYSGTFRVDVVEKQVKYNIFYQVQLNTCSRLITLSLKIKHDFYGFFIFNFRFQVVLQTLNQRAVMESKFYRNHMQ